MVDGLRRQYGESVMSAITLSLIAIMAVALLSIFTSYWITELGAKDAQAINLSGSLRMQTYRLGLAYSQRDDDSIHHQLETLADTWRSPLLVPLQDADPDRVLDDLYQAANRHWNEQILSRITGVPADPHQMAELLPLLDRQVQLTDALVYEFQLSAERRSTLLRLVQVLGLFTIVCVGSLVFYFIRERVEKPLKELTAAADRFRQGDLSARVDCQGRDELALLGEIFNRMGDSLSRSYGELEQRVADRTRTLEFLLDTSRQIMSAYHRPVDYQQIACALSELVNEPRIEICLFTAEGLQPYFHEGACGEISDCSQRDCADCRSAELVQQLRGPLTEHKYPIARDNLQYGLLTVRRDAGQPFSAQESQLVASTADQIALALSLADQKQLDRKVATLDERNIIARELHDSLAQALSYLKIQVTRLQKTAEKQRYDLQEPIIDELKEGLASAYRQLRELLTTFRLKLDESGLQGALSQTVEQLRGRSDMAINLDYQLHDIPLTPSEEIHLLQIVREAGQNAINHSRGRHVNIQLLRLIDDHVLLMVSDDGVGLPAAPERLNHYGLAIMKERARSLAGELTLAGEAGSGTRVSVKFLPEFVRVKLAG